MALSADEINYFNSIVVLSPPIYIQNTWRNGGSEMWEQSCIKIPGGRLRKTDVMSFTEEPAQSSVNLFLSSHSILVASDFGYQILIKLRLDLFKMLAGKKRDTPQISYRHHNFHIKSCGELPAMVTLDVNIKYKSN